MKKFIILASIAILVSTFNNTQIAQAAQVAVPVSAPTIKSITSQAKKGTVISVRGTNFTSTGNTIYFMSGSNIPSAHQGLKQYVADSKDGKTLSFRLLPTVTWTSEAATSPKEVPLVTGIYQVLVTNDRGKSNVLNIKIVSDVVPTPNPVVNIISLNGGESLTRGTIHEIKWTSNVPVNLYIQPVPCTAACSLLIVNNVTGSYMWDVGTSNTAPTLVDGQYKINICPATGGECDSSDNTFTIQTLTTDTNNVVTNTGMFGSSLRVGIGTVSETATATLRAILITATTSPYAINIHTVNLDNGDAIGGGGNVAGGLGWAFIIPPAPEIIAPVLIIATTSSPILLP